MPIPSPVLPGPHFAETFSAEHAYGPLEPALAAVRREVNAMKGRAAYHERRRLRCEPIRESGSSPVESAVDRSAKSTVHGVVNPDFDRRAGALLIGLAVLLAGCTGVANHASGSAAGQRHTISGSVFAVTTGLGCPLSNGLRVTVYDATGTLLAAGAVESVSSRNSGIVSSCHATFSIPRVPESTDYVIRVANGRGEFTREMLDRAGWMVQLVAGQLPNASA